MDIEGMHLHRDDFTFLFRKIREAKQDLRSYAGSFARVVLGDHYVDGKSTWLGWDVRPVYDKDDGETLIALDFVGTVYDDRGPPIHRTTRVDFDSQP